MSNEENILEKVTEEVTEETVVKPYTLRKLKDSDLFPILGIITTVLPNELSGVFVQLTTGQKSINEIGSLAVYKIIVAVLKNIEDVHDELYALLSDISGNTVEEIQNMEFGTTPMMIWDIVDDAKNASFFKVLSKLL